MGRYETPSKLLSGHDCMIAPVVRVHIRATSAKKSRHVNAAFSMFAAVSVISQRLADEVGLEFSTKDVIDVVAPRSWKQIAYMPSDCLTVQCDSGAIGGRMNNNTRYVDRPALQVAPVVSSTMTVDLLLGRDWFQHFGAKTSVIYGPGDMSSKIKCADGPHIALPWGKLDCNPRYNRNTSYMDHIMLVDEHVLTRLDDVRGFTNIESSAAFTYKGGLLDSVMSQHDILPESGHSAEEKATRDLVQRRYGGTEEKSTTGESEWNDDMSAMSEELGDAHERNRMTMSKPEVGQNEMAGQNNGERIREYYHNGGHQQNKGDYAYYEEENCPEDWQDDKYQHGDAYQHEGDDYDDRGGIQYASSYQHANEHQYQYEEEHNNKQEFPSYSVEYQHEGECSKNNEEKQYDRSKINQGDEEYPYWHDNEGGDLYDDVEVSYPWEQLVTPSGDIYFYNADTGESTYTRPH